MQKSNGHMQIWEIIFKREIMLTRNCRSYQNNPGTLSKCVHINHIMNTVTPCALWQLRAADLVSITYTWAASAAFHRADDCVLLFELWINQFLFCFSGLTRHVVGMRKNSVSLFSYIEKNPKLNVKYFLLGVHLNIYKSLVNCVWNINKLNVLLLLYYIMFRLRFI